ncbi:DUF4383 domain-containing protein [Lentzea sp. NPDC102401]|uniref:DUF4383 domain-containing protein n=1 Tax=Lentzea sp. NPDC102401 TaxID=3364128 RepID=UPI0037FA5A5E
MAPRRHSHPGHRKAPLWPIQLLAAVVGTVFLLVGVLGFVPDITARCDQLSFAGHHQDALLLGVFAVSVPHNMIHTAFGVAGLLMASTVRRALIYLIVGSAIYLALWHYGAAFGLNAGCLP